MPSQFQAARQAAPTAEALRALERAQAALQPRLTRWKTLQKSAGPAGDNL